MWHFFESERQMMRCMIVFSMLSLLLTACGPDPRNVICAPQAPGSMRWGYYPGYGCGPVPPAQTIFSDAALRARV
jgi:hypothetical protein